MHPPLHAPPLGRKGEGLGGGKGEEGGGKVGVRQWGNMELREHRHNPQHSIQNGPIFCSTGQLK